MATNTVGRTTVQGATTVGGFNPLTLFTSGEQGVWYDPSDMATMYQDSAGTIPVTAVEQPVGKILDKSGRGNHATQSDTNKRPVLSARVNLLTYTEAFDNSYWTKNGLVTGGMADVTLAPDGTSTADRFVDSAANDTHIAYRNITGSKADTICFFAKANTRTVATIACHDGTSANWAAAAFNLSTGSAATAQVGGTFSAISSIANVGNGWYRCTLTVTSSGNAVGQVKYGVSDSATPTFGAWGDYSYTGNGTSGIYVWGADLRPTNQGVNLPPYQRVIDASTYDTNGFPLYLAFNGTTNSRSLVSSSVNLSTISQACLFAGVRKLGDASTAVIVEPNSTLPNFALFASSSGGANYAIRSYGTGDNVVLYTTSTTQITSVISTSVTSIAADSTAAIATKINGASVSGSVVSSANSTGNFSNSPFYIGARSGSSLYWNGYLYGLIIRGASSTANQITGAENWLNQRTGAY